MHIGNIFTRQGNLKEAGKYLLRALKIAEESGAKQFQRDTLKYLSELKKTEDDYKEALKYYERYTELKDEMSNTDISKKIIELKTSYDLEIQQRESDLQRLKTVEFQPDLFKVEVDKAIKKIQEEKFPTQLQQLLNHDNQTDKRLNTLSIPTMEGFLLVEIGDIIWCESEGRYTNVCFAEKKPIMASRNLAEFEELLVPSGFIRIHKSHLINLKHVKRYIRGEGGQLIMTNGKALNVGRAFKQNLLEKIEQFR
jgi:two-component system LytT family response regulator